MVWLAFVVAAFVPVLATMVFVHLSAVVDAVGALGRRLRRRDVRQPTSAPLERLAADLHRLSVHYDEVERSDAPAKVARLRAATLAYDDVLLSACRTLDIEVPGSPPLRSIERLETEAALAQQGLVW